MKPNSRSTSAFSLIEILIFITIASVFFVIAVSVGTYTLHNMKIDEHKIRATRYAEALNEWLRGEKERDFTDLLLTKAAPDPGLTYCFNTEELTDETSWPSSFGACGDVFALSDIFKREAILTKVPTDTLKVSITVSWKEGQNTFSIPLNTIYTGY